MVTVSGLSKLDYKMDYLVVRSRDGVKRVHLSEISVLMIESTAVSLTAYLLCELAKRKVDVIFCDETRSPQGMYLPLGGSHDTSLKFREQIAWRREMKDLAWAEIVKAKISAQAAVLAAAERDAAADKLYSYLPQVQPADASNREGHAAKVYFNALFGMDFTRDKECVTNAALNYGYSVLLSAFARETAACGYACQLGLFHDNVYNRFNLPCDLMEPFRPLVDLLVFRGEFTVLGHEEKMVLVRMLNRQIPIAGREQYLLNAIRVYCKSIFDAMRAENTALIRVPDYDLSLYENDTVF